MPLQNLLINVDKPEGLTSREVVSKVSRRLGVKKAGHCGTLDPIATGVLVVCTNQATRITSLVSDLPKTYQATMRLGQITDTHDVLGTIVQETSDINLAVEKIQDAIKSFEGTILQVPPMFSAKKFQGRPLYKFARQGIEIQRQPTPIQIDRITLDSYSTPFVTLTVLCSRGTYVRTLCHDIGINLGVGAHLLALRRLAVGPFTIEDSVTLESLSLEGKGVYAMDKAISWLPEFPVKFLSVRKVKNGNPLKLTDLIYSPRNLSNGDLVKIMSPDKKLLAIGQYIEKEEFEIKMKIVFP